MTDNPKNPWGNNGNNPWGNGNNTPDGLPDFDALIKELKDGFKNLMPEGFGGKKGFALLAAVLLCLWGATGFYLVQPQEQAAVLRFGEWVRTTDSGMHYRLPFPVESIRKISVTRENRIEIGNNRSMNDNESLMLTGDENIIDVQFVVFWRIKDAGQYLFNLQSPDGTLRIAAESAMREMVGRTPINEVLTSERQNIQTNSQKLLQTVLDSYASGIEITQVRLLSVDAPPPSVEAFRDVQRAKSEKETLKNQAETYRNDIIPKARGEAERLIQDSEAYRAEIENRAQGDAARFKSVLGAYRRAPNVTRKRLYIETMEDVFSNTKKVLVGKGVSGSGVVPYLPLPGINGGKK
ncbi:MAG: FtsH protease activity modulator HflK [Alphaproteobacteria bacterium]